MNLQIVCIDHISTFDINVKYYLILVLVDTDQLGLLG